MLISPAHGLRWHHPDEHPVLTVVGTIDGRRLTLGSYLSGLESGNEDNFTASLCEGAFAVEHVIDLANRVRALPAADRVVLGSEARFLPSGDAAVVVTVEGEATELRFQFGLERGLKCIAKIMTDSTYWRRLVPDPQIGNEEAALRYARLANAGLIEDDRGLDQLSSIRASFDRYYPEDDDPHPCGLDERLVGVVKTFLDWGELPSISATVGMYVAFCPFVDPEELADIVSSAAAGRVPLTVAGHVEEMFEVAGGKHR